MIGCDILGLRMFSDTLHSAIFARFLAAEILLFSCRLGYMWNKTFLQHFFYFGCNHGLTSSDVVSLGLAGTEDSRDASVARSRITSRQSLRCLCLWPLGTILTIFRDCSWFFREITNVLNYIQSRRRLAEYYNAINSGGSRKKYLGWGPGPSSFGRQQRLSEIYYRTN